MCHYEGPRSHGPTQIEAMERVIHRRGAGAPEHSVQDGWKRVRLGGGRTVCDTLGGKRRLSLKSHTSLSSRSGPPYICSLINS